MRRSRSVCLVGFTFTFVTVCALCGFMLFLVAIRKPERIVEVPQSLLQPEQKDPNAQNDLVDHRSHSKPGVYYSAIDVLDEKKVTVELNGQRSHTHFHDVGPPAVFGTIVSYVWFDNETHKVIGTSVNFTRSFPVGRHTVGLTVADNTRDTHTAYTVVEVLDSIFDGAYCYYYHKNPDPDIKTGPRPFRAYQSDNLTFTSRADFPADVRNGKIHSRCVFVPEQKNFDMRVSAVGPVSLYCKNKQIFPRSEGNVRVFSYKRTANTDQDKDDRSCHFIYNSGNSNNPSFVVRNIDDLQHDYARVLPVITSMEPKESTFDGGGKAIIQGLALNTKIDIYFGNVKADCDVDEATETQISCTVPEMKGGGGGLNSRRVPVRARSRNGESNGLSFHYANRDVALPVKFKEVKVNLGAFSGYFDFITGIKYGPDHRYYCTSMNSHVISFELDSNMKILKKPCRSTSLGSHRRLFGLAFNPRSTKNWLYVSSSVIFWKKEALLSGELSWANGQIHVLRKGSSENGVGCLVETDNSPIITGLPVSNHDHGVNGLVFDNQGRLHILVGGFTNAGQNKNSRLGGVGENPLSAASLVADVEKPGGFDGKITYNPKTAEIAIKRSGEVRVFMAGLRNPFGINIHSNGNIYAMDNGPSQGYGGKSLDCNTEQEFEDSEERYMVDKLVLVKDGKYGGHPNRNRGKNEKKPYECVFHSVLDKDTEPGSEYLPPLATLESSTNGVVEYMSNAFNGEMKGDLLLSMYATDKSEGKIWRVGLNEAGTAVERGPSGLLPRSGLSMELTPGGGLIAARVFKAAEDDRLVAYKPDVKSLLAAFVSVMPNRGSPRGGYWVLVTGRKLGANPSAIFGDNSRTCKGKDVRIKKAGESFLCKVPAFGGGKATGVHVWIRHTAGGGPELLKSKGVDFVYTNL